MRQRFIQDRVTGELLPASEYHATRNRAPYVMGDLPDYESPVDGRVVHGRAGRREDLRRHGCRPWEGMEAERAEATRQRAYDAQRAEHSLDRAARVAFAQLSPAQRRMLERL